MGLINKFARESSSDILHPSLFYIEMPFYFAPIPPVFSSPLSSSLRPSFPSHPIPIVNHQPHRELYVLPRGFSTMCHTKPVNAERNLIASLQLLMGCHLDCLDTYIEGLLSALYPAVARSSSRFRLPRWVQCAPTRHYHPIVYLVLRPSGLTLDPLLPRR